MLGAEQVCDNRPPNRSAATQVPLVLSSLQRPLPHALSDSRLSTTRSAFITIFIGEATRSKRKRLPACGTQPTLTTVLAASRPETRAVTTADANQSDPDGPSERRTLKRAPSVRLRTENEFSTQDQERAAPPRRPHGGRRAQAPAPLSEACDHVWTHGPSVGVHSGFRTPRISQEGKHKSPFSSFSASN